MWRFSSIKYSRDDILRIAGTSWRWFKRKIALCPYAMLIKQHRKQGTCSDSLDLVTEMWKRDQWLTRPVQLTSLHPLIDRWSVWSFWSTDKFLIFLVDRGAFWSLWSTGELSDLSDQHSCEHSDLSDRQVNFLIFLIGRWALASQGMRTNTLPSKYPF